MFLIFNQQKTGFVIFGDGCSIYASSSIHINDDKGYVYLYCPGDFDQDGGAIYGVYKNIEQAREVVNDIYYQIIDGKSEYKMPPEDIVDKYKSCEKWHGEIKIDELSLSVRSYNLLKRAGISMVNQLASLSEKDLLKIPHMGRKSLEEIEKAVDEAKNKYMI